MFMPQPRLQRRERASMAFNGAQVQGPDVSLWQPTLDGVGRGGPGEGCKVRSSWGSWVSALDCTTAGKKGFLSTWAAAQLQEAHTDQKPEVLKVTPWKPTANALPFTMPPWPLFSLLTPCFLISGKGPSSETPGPSRTKLLLLTFGPDCQTHNWVITSRETEHAGPMLLRPRAEQRPLSVGRWQFQCHLFRT